MNLMKRNYLALLLLIATSASLHAKGNIMERHHNINYIEIPTKDIEASKSFFNTVFGWTFIDYGPEYSSFTARGIDGGFYTSKETVSTKTGSPLIVLYSARLEETQKAVEAAGGKIIEPIFSFPGGRRFHFTDTAGNEYAVWSE
jgi:predicted enzyme related to lactoylglutathione lyase